MNSVFKHAICGAIVALVFTAAGWTQQEDEAPAVHLLMTVVTYEPAMAADGDAAWGEMMAQAQARGHAYETAVFGFDFDRWIVTPFGENHAGLDTLFAARSDVSRDNAAFNDAYSRHLAAIREVDTFILRYEPELSLNGDTAAPDGSGYLEVHRIDIKPGQRQAFERSAREIGALYDGLGMDVAYRMYRGGIGAPGAYYVVFYGEDRASFAAYEAEMQARIWQAENAQEIAARFYATITGEQTIPLRPMRDLSYSPSSDN